MLFFEDSYGPGVYPFSNPGVFDEPRGGNSRTPLQGAKPEECLPSATSLGSAAPKPELANSRVLRTGVYKRSTLDSGSSGISSRFSVEDPARRFLPAY